VKNKLIPMFVGFIVVSSGVIGYQFSSHSIEQSNATKQLKAEIATMQAAREQKLTVNEKEFHKCVSVYSILLDEAKKYGDRFEVSKRRAELNDCGVFLR
jgi:predicted negative regulator of RcsB-dependent stress response